jgi:hypothetical protein
MPQQTFGRPKLFEVTCQNLLFWGYNIVSSIYLLGWEWEPKVCFKFKKKKPF